MTDATVIKFFTGAARGFNQPTVCHSGKPKPNACSAVSQEPGREGWALVRNPFDRGRRDGWWCKDCARQFREDLTKQGFTATSQDIPIPPPGAARG